MKTKEFIQKVKSLGLDVEYDYHSYEENLEVVLFNSLIVNVSNDCEYEFDTNYPDFRKLSKKRKKDLFELLVEYSSTPIEERDKEKNEVEKEKKYYLKHKFLTNENSECYLNYIFNYNDWILNDNTMCNDFKTQFTKQEIEEIKAKFGTDLNDFEMIEAKGE